MSNTPVSKIKVIQHNVRAWTTNKLALTNAYAKEDPDIILINSHGVLDGESLKIQNYNVHRTNTDNSRNNGAAIAIRRNLPYKLLDDFETDMIGATITTRQGPIHIVTAYIPPRREYMYYGDYYSILTKPEPVYILADLNAKHQGLGDREYNHVGEVVMQLIDRGHAQHIGPHFATFINPRSSTRPDIILTNNEAFHNTYSRVGGLTPSDHLPIVFTISASPIQIPTRSRPSTKQANWQGYKDELEIVPTIEPQGSSRAAINDAVAAWTQQIQQASANNIPVVRHTTLPHYRTTHETRMLQVQHDALYQDIQQNGPSHAKYTRLLEIRNRMQRLYKELAAEAWNRLIAEMDIEADSKKFWASVKRLQGNNKDTSAQYIRDHQNNKIYEPQKKEEIFRKYWEKIFKISDEENQRFDQEHHENVIRDNDLYRNELIPYETSDLNRLTRFFPPITMAEMTAALNSFKHKAPGESGIAKPALANLPNNMKKNLLEIFNNCISMGYFPEAWKMAVMIFIPKEGKSPNSHVNYRPISLLEVQGKLLEKLLNRRLITFLERHDLQNDRQHGFRPGRSTQTALALMYETIATAKANRQNVDLLFTDISRAFDKVWHEGLLYKLRRLHLPDCFLRTLCSYINNRTAKIRIEEYKGPPFKLECSVPQGGCLASTLFTTYTADKPPPAGHSEYLEYADDVSQVVVQAGRPRMFARTSGRVGATFTQWEKKWKITNNADKLEVLAIGRRDPPPITVNNKIIAYSKECKTLGLTITTNGFYKHVSNRVTSARAQMRKLYRFKNLNSKNKRKLYLALVRTKLTYPIVPLHAMSTRQITKLQMVQNQGARFITNTRRIERKTSEYIHQQAELEAVNIYLNKQAEKIWTTITENVKEESLQKLELFEGRTYIKKYPSSRALSNEEPTPIYT